MNLTIISPYSHLNGHYWPYTVDLLCALSAAGKDFHVHASRKPRYPIDGFNSEWRACCPYSRLLLTDGYRARHWGSKADTVVRNIEFRSCLKSALHCKTGNVMRHHIHCIESRHRILLGAVLGSAHTFSTLCVGDPPDNLSSEREGAYRKAFETQRLRFIVETESVRKAWEPLAGKNVIHIPAALPWAKHKPIPQTDARTSLGLPADATICLFFGTHREGKDYRTAIEAAKASESKPLLLFVGPLISGNDPETLATLLGYPNCIFRTGYLPDAQVPTVFDACDAVMLPYAENYTKGSAVLLQAAHFAKPVIATASGHLRDFVELNRTGLLYESGSVVGLAQCYDELSALKTAGDVATSWSFEQARHRYSWSTLSEIYLRIFAQEHESKHKS